MATRREVLTLAGGGLLLAGTGGCSPRGGRTGAAAPPAGPFDVLYAESAGGLGVLDARGGQPVLAGAPGIATPDWRRLVTTAGAGAGTRVTFREGPSARPIAEIVVPEPVSLRAVAASGGLAALASGTAPGASGAGTNGDVSPYGPIGRDSTTIVIVDPGGHQTRFTVAGCVEPEAFTPDGRTLYILDFLPPRRPDRYRVRAIDLSTGQPGPLQSRNKQVVRPGAEEEMRGEGRQAVYDPDEGRLFTLYTHQPDHLHTRDLLAGATGAGVHAFVHMLSLTEKWAFCIDLPEPFGLGPAPAHTIARSAVGGGIYVADLSTGTVARLDPGGLNVSQVAAFQPAGGTGGSQAGSGTGTSATSIDGERLFLGSGTTVVVLDSRLDATDRWTLADPVRGVAPSPDGRRLYVGQRDSVAVLDAGSGRLTGRVAAPGLVALRHAAPGG